jgi:hypothetical protein
VESGLGIPSANILVCHVSQAGVVVLALWDHRIDLVDANKQKRLLFGAFSGNLLVSSCAVQCTTHTCEVCAGSGRVYRGVFDAGGEV